MDVPKQPLAFADRQIDHIAGDQPLRGVETGQRLFEAQIRRVLYASHSVSSLQPGAEGIRVAEEFRIGVGKPERPACSESLLEFHLHGMISRISTLRSAVSDIQ